MLRTTNMSSEFSCDIAEKGIEMLKDAFGNKLNIFIGHRRNDVATNLEFSFNTINYTIKIYEDDNLIICGIKSYTYKEIVYEDDDLFLLTAVRNTLSASEQTIQKFIELLINDEYSYIKPIISQLVDLKNQINLKDSSQKSFFLRTAEYILKEIKT